MEKLLLDEETGISWAKFCAHSDTTNLKIVIIIEDEVV